jgi:hypothetical protein
MTAHPFDIVRPEALEGTNGAPGRPALVYGPGCAWPPIHDPKYEGYIIYIRSLFFPLILTTL